MPAKQQEQQPQVAAEEVKELVHGERGIALQPGVVHVKHEHPSGKLVTFKVITH
jgi:hypothetical protein